eukprot:Opistho-2@26164
MGTLRARLCVAAVLLCSAYAAVAMQFGDNIKLVDGIYDAENQLFTVPDSRLFVSAGDNVYEITTDGNGTYGKTPMFENATYCLGLSQVGNVVFVVRQLKGCIDAVLSDTNLLSAATLIPGEPLVFRDVFQFSDIAIPNGLTADPSGRYLFVSDSAYLRGTGKIIRVEISESDPFVVSNQVTWLDHSLAGTPNGLRFFNGSIYYTDTGALRRVAVNEDMSAGDQVELYKASTILDDLTVIASGDGTAVILFVDYLRGGIAGVDSWTGALVSASAHDLFVGPSSVMQGMPPLFQPDELVVTDKGLICDKDGNGNFFSALSFSLDSSRRL